MERSYAKASIENRSSLTAVRRMRRSDGFRLPAAFDGDVARCAAGYRISEFLAYGKIRYVDDLATDQNSRSENLGGRMLDWLTQEARRNGCGQLHLDSGVQRHDAHRFYSRESMTIISYHFSKPL